MIVLDVVIEKPIPLPGKTTELKRLTDFDIGGSSIWQILKLYFENYKIEILIIGLLILAFVVIVVARIFLKKSLEKL